MSTDSRTCPSCQVTSVLHIETQAKQLKHQGLGFMAVGSSLNAKAPVPEALSYKA